MIASSAVLALLVGIAEVCSTNGVVVGSSYTEALRAAGHVPVVVCRTAAAEDLDRVVASLDLLLLPGGEDVDPARYGERPSPRLGRVNAVRDAFEEQLFRAAVRHEVPLYGTCRGLQHLNVLFGGTLHQDLPSELGERYTVEHRTGPSARAAQVDRRHQIAVLPGSRLAAACGARAAWVNSLHHQAVKGLAPGLEVTAWTPDGVVEAVECAWYPAAGVQFHPECLAARAGDPVWTRFFANLGAFAGRRPSRPVASRPIGVFDSGIGGLSVLEQLLTLDAFDNATGEARADGIPDFADEDFVYFGDQANMPYGRYDAAGRADFLRELVVRDAQFVLGSQGHDPAKAVVIACNTATAYGLARLQAMPRPHDAAVVGVVNAGVEAALDATKDETGAFAIAVMATPATIASGVYQRALGGALKGRADVAVAARGGFGLAEAVESGDPDMRLCARTNLVALVEDYRAKGGTAPIRALILGCTHYPFVVDAFREAFAELRARPDCAGLVGESVVFVDPAVYTAVAAYRSLRAAGRLRPKGAPRAGAPVKAFLSVGKDGPLSDAVKYGRACGLRDIGTQVVPFAEAGLSEAAKRSVVNSFPLCARALLIAK